MLRLPFTAAAAGDPVALDLIQAAARSLAELASAWLATVRERVALVGGMAEAIKPYLPAAMTDILSTAQFDALEGAILLVGGPVPSFGLKRRA